MRYTIALAIISLSGSPALATAPSANISPAYVQATPNKTLAFTTSLSGPIAWQVDFINGGNEAVGTIDSTGHYTAPATLPSPAVVTITAATIGVIGQRSTATVSLLPQLPSGTTYFVATNGADTNPGTLAAPFATLAHTQAVVKPGDTVLVRGGTYHAATQMTASGNAGSPITYSNYPGETPVIDGTGVAIPNQQGGLFNLGNVSDIIITGFTIQNFTTSKVTEVPIGIFMYGAGDSIQIINNHVTAITTTAVPNINKCNSNALGIAFYAVSAKAPIANIVVSGNEVDHLKTGCSESDTISGNADGFLFTANYVHDNDNIGFDAIGFEKGTGPNNSPLNQARNGEVRGNIVQNITSYGNPDYGKQYAADGIYVDGGTQIIIEQNIVDNADVGIELASETLGHVTSYVTARDNIVMNDPSNGISIGGYGAKRGGTQNCAVINNTLYQNDTMNTGSGELQIQYNASNNLIANNVVYGLSAIGAGNSNHRLLNNYTKNTVAPATLMNNLYYTPDGAARAVFRWNGKTYAGLAAYQTASGEDAASLFGDPLFSAPATGQFFLGTGSPALGLGMLNPAMAGAADITGALLPDATPLAAGAIQPAS